MSKKQISQKQLQANRQNAKKSTGPQTPEGKARSSQNALKHGLLARQILINDDDPNEKTEDFDQLLSDLVDELQPDGRIQSLLVQRIAVCYWRLRRAYRFEAQSLIRQREDEFSPFEELARSVSGRKPEPFARILPYEKRMTLLVRYESMIDRQLNKAMTQLQKLQSSPMPVQRSSPTARPLQSSKRLSRVSQRDLPPCQ
ncbi:MAG: hypothetical protein ACYTA5_09140, partial [Planctomycetota bacterium]